MKLFGPFRRLLDKEEIEIELQAGNDVQDLLCVLFPSPEVRKEIIDEKGDGGDHVAILKNGRHIQSLEGLSTKLEEGDEIVIVPPSGGG